MSQKLQDTKIYTTETTRIRDEVDRLNVEANKIRIKDPTVAHEMLVKAEALANSIGYRDGLAFSVLNQCFYIFYILGNIIDTYRLHKRAVLIFEETQNTKGLAWASIIAGSMYAQQGEYEKAFAAFRYSLANFDKDDIESERLATYLLGNLYLDLKDYTSSIPLHERSLALSIDLDETFATSNAYISLANAYHEQGDLEKAIELLEKALVITKEAQTTSEARALHNLGLVYETKGDYLKAISLIEKSLAKREEINNKQGIITCLLSLGKLYARMQNYDDAIKVLHKAIAISIPLNSKPKMMRAYQELALIYKEMQQPWLALESYEKFMEMKGEVLGEEASSQLRNASAIYEAEQARKEAEIEKLRNVELKEAYERIEAQNLHIIDSIKYAKRIQEAILDPIDTVTQQLGNAFIFYSAKDIVSGDFYWYGEVEHDDEPNKKYKIIIAADCTGHGVPGAFMTVMGNDFLNDIIMNQQIINPSEILYKLDTKVTTTLQKHGKENSRTNDGMDISILVIDEEKQKIYFAAAKHPLYLVRNKEIHEIKGSKYPIGSSHYRVKNFEMQTFDLQQGDIFYLSSDGYQDQFGDDDKGKFMKKRFREFLFSISYLPMPEQHDILKNTILEWKGNKIQTDDWLILGIKY